MDTSAIPPRSVLVPVANPDTAAQLVELGARLARRVGGGLMLLHAAPGEAAPAEAPEPDDEARALLEAARTHAATHDVPVETRYREAPTVAEAIIRATQEAHVEHLIMGWRGEVTEGKTVIGEHIDAVVRESGCHTIVMQQGALGTGEQVLVPVANPHAAPLALLVASLLRAEGAYAITVLHLAPLALSEKEKDAFRAALFALAETGGSGRPPLFDDASQVEVLFEVQEDPAHELALHSGYYDRMILGTPRSGYAGGPVFARFQVDIAREARCPVVFVRPREKGARFSF